MPPLKSGDTSGEAIQAIFPRSKYVSKRANFRKINKVINIGQRVPWAEIHFSSRIQREGAAADSSMTHDHCLINCRSSSHQLASSHRLSFIVSSVCVIVSSTSCRLCVCMIIQAAEGQPARPGARQCGVSVCEIYIYMYRYNIYTHTYIYIYIYICVCVYVCV
jgi:hypothetical protein